MKNKVFYRTGTSTICVAILASLGACGNGLPDCADTEVLNRFREAIPRDAVQRISDNIEAAGNWSRPGAQHLRDLLDEFGHGIKVQVKDIASDGADPTAKKSSCSAAVSVSTLGGSTESRRMSYAIQRTVDDKDFLLSVPDYPLLLEAVGWAFTIYSEREKTSAAATTVPAAVSPAVSQEVRGKACIESRMAEWRRDLDGRQQALVAEAERENREFRPLSPVQEDESREAALQQAQKECP